jgi:Mg-chelatase subunit ChlD
MAEVQEEVVDPASSPTASAENMETEHLEKIALNGQAEQETYPYDREVACWSMVSLQAPAFEPTERSNIDVVTVVDKSGSMSGEKIGLVRETLHFVVDQRESVYFSLFGLSHALI